jgi:hypothetical protein
MKRKVSAVVCALLIALSAISYAAAPVKVYSTAQTASGKKDMEPNVYPVVVAVVVAAYMVERVANATKATADARRANAEANQAEARAGTCPASSTLCSGDSFPEAALD